MLNMLYFGNNLQKRSLSLTSRTANGRVCYYSGIFVLS